MKEVRRELEQKDEQILQLRQSLGHMTSRYSTLQQSKKGMEGYRNQLDWDEEVQKAYKTLGYHIKNFCETCLGGKPFIKGVNKDQAENFNSMTAKSIWEVCLQDEDYKAKFFQGAVWHYLCLHLLSYPLAAYSKPMSDGMSQVQIAQLSEYRLKKDTPRMARLNAWRRDTGRLLHESLGAEPNNAWSFSPVHCNHVATEMAKLFHRYSGAGTLEVVQSQLRNVVDLAVKLASLISRADAHYLVAYHGKYLNEASYGFKAERASMKILISFSGHLDDYDVPVDFVIRPGLLRYGEPDGEGMERNVLVKTLICV
ncbi:hypothetical protein P8C59_003597 [Phyllachora maydis]|uniref:Uncharacterized protein n=1 Tax=Phyllachora maydis TaxID=1825666 RepID=A0AAD9MAH7_9PEZI|nr:hypothetical protein P8C59_003597 [Phyllachora maydis]